MKYFDMSIIFMIKYLIPWSNCVKNSLTVAPW